MASTMVLIRSYKIVLQDKYKLLTLHSVYYNKHTFIEMFMIIKFREPRGLFEKILISSNYYNNRIIL